MIVTLEGLSCAGKTETAQLLKQTYPSVYQVIPELLLGVPTTLTTEYCKENDLAKAQLAQSIDRPGRVVLMDRGYMSTVVYAYAASETGQEELTEWYAGMHEDGIMQVPDKLVYMQLDPTVAIERAIAKGRYTSNIAWYRNVNRAISKYEALLVDSEHVTEIHRMDAGRFLGQVASDVHVRVAGASAVL